MCLAEAFEVPRNVWTHLVKPKEHLHVLGRGL
jgi:hypothetical protein